MWKALVLASLVILSLSLGVAPSAHAAKSIEDHARDQVLKGTAAFNLGHFDEAVTLYEEAYRLVQDPSLLFNIAQSYRLAHQPEKAMIAYRSFLRTAASDDPNRDLAERRVADLQKQIDERKAAQAATEPSMPPATDEGSARPLPEAAPPVPDPDPVTIQEESSPSPSVETSAPFYKRWWFWGTVGGAVVAGTVTAILLASGAKGQCAGESNACLGVK